MRRLRNLVALCFVVLFASSAFAATLPRGDLPAGYEDWEKRVHACIVKKGVQVELETYTLRSIEAIISAVSIWSMNGEPFEVKYFEPMLDPNSLSGYRASGFTMVLDRKGQWVTLGARGRTMTNNELLLLRLSRFTYLERHGVSEKEFTSALAACNRDRPGALR